MKNERLIVYTAMFGDYDDLKEPEVNCPDCDFVCFTDQPIASRTWQICNVKPRVIQSGKSLNRFFKMNPHKLFPDHSESLYVDSNIVIKKNPRTIIGQSLTNWQIAAYPHPFRTNVLQEAVVCAQIGYGLWPSFKRQIKRYENLGFTATLNPLFECNILYRKHLLQAVITVMELWWEEYARGVKRDQISFPFVAWKNKVVVTPLPFQPIRSTLGPFGLTEGHKIARGYRARSIARFNALFYNLTSDSPF